MRLPAPRGALSGEVLRALTAPPGGTWLARSPRWSDRSPHPFADDDLQLSLLLCYELHYRGLVGVDDRWEWDPGLLRFRAALEARFEAALRAEVPTPTAGVGRVADDLRGVLDADDGPPLASYLHRRGTLEQFRELAAHRSLYQLKEADPHTWAIPRLHGRAKAALVEVQSDEYGGGRPDRMHSVLFAQTMRALGLEDTYGRYVDEVPAVTLAATNLVSLFGLHRRLRGALLGHLAVLEMDSSVPNARYADGLRRLGLDRQATEFYDEHVEADAVHEQIAAVDMCGAFVAAEPELAADVRWGAACCVALDARLRAHLMSAWRAGRSSMRRASGRAA